MTLPDELTIRFEYSPPQDAQALMERPELRYIFKYWWPVGLGGLALIFLFNSPYRSLTDFLVLFALMTPVMASFLLIPHFLKRTALSGARRRSKERLDLLEIRSFRPDGFVSAPAWSEPVPWPFITKVVEVERFFYVFHSGSDVPEYVPKAAMSDAEIAELRALLRKQLGSQSTQLKLYPTAPLVGGST